MTEAAVTTSTTRAAAFKDIATLGSWVRVEIPWKLIEPSAGARSWTVADAMVNQALNAGLRVLAMVVHPPTGFTTDRFEVVMRDLAARYPRIEAWEIWNEQNLHAFFAKANATNWVPFLQAGYRGVKQGNPKATVVFGGLAACATYTGLAFTPWPVWFHNEDPVSFLTAAYRAGAKGYFDVLGYHPYALTHDFKPMPFSPTQEYIADIDKLHDVMLANGDDKEMWATEFGWNMDKGVTAAQQGEWIKAEMAHLQSRSFVTKAFVYCYKDNTKTQFGLTTNGVPKLSYYAWKSLI